MTCCGGSGNNQFRQEAENWTDEDLFMSLASVDSQAGDHHQTRHQIKTMRSISSQSSKSVPQGENGSGTGDASDDVGAINILPWDSSINLSVHQPLYPPGKIIHLVRKYPKPPPGDK